MMGDEQIRYYVPCQYLHEKVEKRLREYWPNMRKIQMLKKELDLLDKRQDNLKAIDINKPAESRKHERKSSIDSFVTNKEDTKALIKAEIKRMEDENNRIDFMIRIVDEPFGKLLSLRYIYQAEWVKVAIDTDRYIIKEEKLWKKPTSNIVTKKYTFVFNETMLIKERDNTEEFLPDDISIIIAQNKKLNEHIPVTDMLSFTNVNVLPISDNIPLEIINFLDPTIEALFFEDIETKSLVHLKFYGNDEIILNTPAELEHYLSSGTIKGIIAFIQAFMPARRS